MTRSRDAALLLPCALVGISLGSHLAGCGNKSRSASSAPAVIPSDLRVRVEPTEAEAAVRAQEDRLVALGYAHPGPRRVRVYRDPWVSPARLPATAPDGSAMAVSGCCMLGGTWPNGDMDLADPIYLIHESVHSTHRGQEHGPPWHTEPWWDRWQSKPELNPGDVP